MAVIILWSWSRDVMACLGNKSVLFDKAVLAVANAESYVAIPVKTNPSQLHFSGVGTATASGTWCGRGMLGTPAPVWVGGALSPPPMPSPAHFFSQPYPIFPRLE